MPGSERREGALGFGKTADAASREKAMKALSEFLRPEFLSRIDEVIVFRNLSEDDFVRIAGLMMHEYVGSLEERGIRFTYDEAACKWLAHKAYGGRSGARDLRNLIRREVEDKIAMLLVEKGEDAVSGIAVTVRDDALAIDSL